MTRSLHCVGVVIVIALTILICTKQAAAQNKNDEKAIRDVIAKFEETWNKHDPDTFIEVVCGGCGLYKSVWSPSQRTQ